jgi:phosphate starvation-inducible PhoH-like protein
MSDMTRSELELLPADNERLANLCGQFDEHLRQVELRLGVAIKARGSLFQIEGDKTLVAKADKLLRHLYLATEKETLTPAEINLYLQESGIESIDKELDSDVFSVDTRRGVIRGRGPNQLKYLANIQSKDINFGIGPAGTGKTYLAVASAVHALKTERTQRLVLVRPAVEAGERLGFLPGDLSQKVDPYLRPLYDALYEMLGFEHVMRLIERNVIEIAPLAFMRGRTLNDSFVILDEAQNTTVEQMKMFLTRIGFGSTAVVTGDITQVDLPNSQISGLRDVIGVLRDVPGISFTFFEAKDVVRHPLVQRVVQAYEKHEGNE